MMDSSALKNHHPLTHHPHTSSTHHPELPHFASNSSWIVVDLGTGKAATKAFQTTTSFRAKYPAKRATEIDQS